MSSVSGLGVLRRKYAKGGLAYADGGDVSDSDSPLVIDIDTPNGPGSQPVTGLGAPAPAPAPDDAAHIDLGSERAKLPPDPMDSLHDADTALLDPGLMMRAGMDQVMGSRQRIEAALANSQAGQERARGEVMDALNHQYKGAPWAAFTAAVMQPSASPMSSVGRAIGAYGAVKNQQANQEMGIDELLAKYDNANANQDFNQRIAAEREGMTGLSTLSNMQGIGMKMLLMRLRMQLANSDLAKAAQLRGGAAGAGGTGAPGAPGPNGQPGGNIDADRYEAAAKEQLGMGGLKEFLLTHPQAKAVDLPDRINMVDPNDPSRVLASFPKGIPPQQAAEMRDKGIAVPQTGAQGAPAASGAPAQPQQAQNAAPGLNVDPATGDVQNAQQQPVTSPDQTSRVPSGPAAAASGDSSAAQSAAAANQQGAQGANAQPQQVADFDPKTGLPTPQMIGANVRNYVSGFGLPPDQTRAMYQKMVTSQPGVLGQTRQAVQSADDVISLIDRDLQGLQGVNPTMQLGPVGEFMKHFKGSGAFNLSQDVQTIQANLVKQAITDLRSASTNGSLGFRLTQGEIGILQKAVRNLNQGQVGQFIQNMQYIRDQFKLFQNRATSAYEQAYGPLPLDSRPGYNSQWRLEKAQ